MYAAIDMKSFYASVECVEHGFDPLTANLVVADSSRTEKTICLAVSPALKAFGIPGRPRLFEVIQRVREINKVRYKNNGYKKLPHSSKNGREVMENQDYELDYYVVPPRMELYELYSARIYSVLLRYFSPEDIHVYSCDESFIFIKPYLALYRAAPHELIMRVIKDILSETGITATAGIGTNMYLCKVAMDIVAKKMPADENGVRIAELNEEEYRKQLWEHTPLQDFWGYGNGISKHLNRLGLNNMGDICLLSENDEEILYREFGVNAEIIIDHAWGWESCTIKDIHEYSPKNRSLNTSQVLSRPYSNSEAKIVLREMVYSLALKLIDIGYVSDQVSLAVSYDGTDVYDKYSGSWSTDRYGRKVPKSSSGNRKIEYTSSVKLLDHAILGLFREKTDSKLKIHKLSISMNNIIPETEVPEKFIQYDMFSNTDEAEKIADSEEKRLEKEKSLNKAVIKIKDRYGKNAVLKGLDLLDSATARERNRQIGGHRA